MKVITAPEPYECLPTDIKCFLAGGITNCPDWQSEVIEVLEDFDTKHPGQLDNLVLFNPRRENFPIHDPNAALEQITWEFKWLQQMDIFSMWFSGGESDQPICMYELGSNICRMMEKFPHDYPERILVSCDSAYRRSQDVKIQTHLAFSSNGSWDPNIICKADPILYAQQIVKMYKSAKARANAQTSK